MRVIFLDIDGVLNSAVYDRERGWDDGNIDESRMRLLADIVEETEAVIVLTSSWRRHWWPDPGDCDAMGREIHEVFVRNGLTIYDKTGEDWNRAREIQNWLDDYSDEVESFVILDDIFGGWGALEDHLVQTNYRIGRGLEVEHAQQAIQILNGNA